MLDLLKNDPAAIAEAGYEFNVVLPDGTETEAKIKVRGTNSAVVKNFARKSFSEMQQKQKIAKRKGKDDDLSIEEAEEFTIEDASCRVISWSGIAEGGTELQATPENIKSVLTRYPFIREQILKESNNIYNFRH